MKQLALDMVERDRYLAYVEDQLAKRNNGFSERISRDVLERTELILREIERRLEKLEGRTDARLAALSAQLTALRAEIARREAPDPSKVDRTTPSVSPGQ
jgi:50S ribosomal subunit-associated GTPase HflX